MLHKSIENNKCSNYNNYVMKISKLNTPIEQMAKALFKDTIGNDLGKKYPYLPKMYEHDIFISEQKLSHKETSKNRRKW